MRRLPVSRRQPDYACRRIAGRSLHDHIRHERIERARWLLVWTKRPVTAVAGRSGFMYPTRPSDAFREDLGMTSTEDRQRNQMADRGR